LDKLLSFYEAPNPIHKKGAKQLNPTLGGYLNKIISYWLLKMPQVLLLYLSDDDRRLKIVENMFNHFYLSHCVTDLLVRMLTI
jgi:hypothetical protein